MNTSDMLDFHAFLDVFNSDKKLLEACQLTDNTKLVSFAYVQARGRYELEVEGGVYHFRLYQQTIVAIIFYNHVSKEMRIMTWVGHEYIASVIDI